MTWLDYTTAQFRLSQKVYWKRIGIALTATVVPLGLGMLISVQMSNKGSVNGAPGGIYTLTGFMAFALFFTVYNLVNAVTSRRDALVYKRLRASSLPDSSIFVGEGMTAAVPSCGVAVVLFVFGLVVLHAGAPANPLLLLVGVLLGAAMFAFIAIGLSGVLPSAESSMWIVTPIMVVFMMCSGIYGPLAQLPRPLAEVAAYLPMSPVVSVLRTAYLGQDFASHEALMNLGRSGAHLSFLGEWRASAGGLSIMVAWTTVGFALAKKYFRWDPKRSG